MSIFQKRLNPPQSGKKLQFENTPLSKFEYLADGKTRSFSTESGGPLRANGLVETNEKRPCPFPKTTRRHFTPAVKRSDGTIVAFRSFLSCGHTMRAHAEMKITEIFSAIIVITSTIICDVSSFPFGCIPTLRCTRTLDSFFGRTVRRRIIKKRETCRTSAMRYPSYLSRTINNVARDRPVVPGRPRRKIIRQNQNVNEPSTRWRDHGIMSTARDVTSPLTFSNPTHRGSSNPAKNTMETNAKCLEKFETFGQSKGTARTSLKRQQITLFAPRRSLRASLIVRIRWLVYRIRSRDGFGWFHRFQ